MLERGWSSSPSVTGVQEGVGLTLAHSPPLMPHELFPFVCLYMAHWDQEFPAQNSVLLWTHHMHPLVPFQILRYHVTKGKLSGPEGHAEELVSFM